jgi:hypothetical protein
VDGAGTGLDADLLDGQQGSYYTNATNITTGTLPYAQIPANVINTTAAYTRTGITTFSANVILGSSGLSANGGFGTAGHTLHSNGTATYWSADDQGVTSVATANGLTGGTITSTGTLGVATGSTLTVNTTGIHVNTTLSIASLAATSNLSVGNSTVNTYITGTQVQGNQNDTVSAPAYSWSTDTTTGLYRPAASQIAVAIAGVQRLLINATTISTNTAISGTTFTGNVTGTASNSSALGSVSLGTLQGQITGNAATAYSNAVSNAAALYQTSAGLTANVLTRTANNSTNFGGYTWAAPGALGTSTANSGAFTTLTTTRSGVANTVAPTTGQAVSYTAMNGGRTYYGYDLNTQPSLYEARFVNIAASTNIPSGMSSDGYWFGMGAGDTTTRGFSLMGTTSHGLWYKSHNGGSWTKTVDTTGATFTGNVAMGNNYITGPALKAYSEFVSNTTVSGAATTLDLSTSNFFNLTMSSNTTFTFSNAPTGRVVSFVIVAAQDATGGRTITWPTGTKYAGGVSPPQTTTANAIDIWNVLTYNAGSTWIVSLAVKGAA